MLLQPWKFRRPSHLCRTGCGISALGIHTYGCYGGGLDWNTGTSFNYTTLGSPLATVTSRRTGRERRRRRTRDQTEFTGGLTHSAYHKMVLQRHTGRTQWEKALTNPSPTALTVRRAHKLSLPGDPRPLPNPTDGGTYKFHHWTRQYTLVVNSGRQQFDIFLRADLHKRLSGSRSPSRYRCHSGNISSKTLGSMTPRSACGQTR